MARKFMWFVGAICIVATSFFVTTYLLDQLGTTQSVSVAVGPCAGANPFQLPRPFSAWGGFAFAADIPRFRDSADAEDNISLSKLVLCEDGKPLGPPHSIHEDIRHKGVGRYSHWEKDLIFSASDNSNPNSNGRSYWVLVPR